MLEKNELRLLFTCLQRNKIVFQVTNQRKTTSHLKCLTPASKFQISYLLSLRGRRKGRDHDDDEDDDDEDEEKKHEMKERADGLWQWRMDEGETERKIYAESAMIYDLQLTWNLPINFHVFTLMLFAKAGS